MARLSAVLAAAVLAVLALAPATPAASGTTLRISAVAAGLRYSTTHLAAKPGKVTIVMKNLSTLPHDIAIRGKGVNAKGKVVTKGGVSTVTTTLKKGSYQFYCSVDAHAQAGMKGTLTVK